MKLNKKQKQAVEYVDDPLLIVAGAGTGKTTVLTQKIKYLIEKKGVKPQEILALTFTDKAANEMVERLDEVMPYGYEEPWVHTFHRFGDRVLKREGLEMGLDPGYKIMSSTQQYLLIKKHLFEFPLDYYRPLGNPNKFIWGLITFFSRCADESISAAQIKSYAKSILKQVQNDDARKEEGEKLLEAARALEFYEELKIAESVMDFGDLIGKTLELFEKRKSVLAKYKKQFRHVLVDEFQDTNYAQYKMVQLLAPAKEKPGLTVVGDDSQSIYRFRGAAISNIMQFMDDYPKAKQVVLTNNYRSNQKILDGAYALIKQNDPETLEVKLGIDKNLRSMKHESRSKNNDAALDPSTTLRFAQDDKGEVKKKSKAVVVECGSGDNEVEFVVEKIYELLAKGKYSYGDFAILARANSQLEPYVTALKQQGLPYRRVGNRGLFDQTEIKTLVNFLRTVVRPEEALALFELLTYPGFGIKNELVLRAMQSARRKSVTLWDEIKEIEELKSLVELVSAGQERVNEKRASELLLGFVEETGYLKKWLETESLENNLAIKNLNKFFEYIKGLERAGSVSVVRLVEELEELVEAGENPSQAEIEDIDAIAVSTIHSAKGLEFGVVFVVSVVAGRFPSYNRKDQIELPDEVLHEDLPEFDHTAEERRLFYVAVTRARDQLYLSWASDYGGARKWKPSGFLEETGFGREKYEQKQLSLLTGKKKATPVIEPMVGEFKLKQTSYSQIDTFRLCPLKYKYRYILRIPAEPHHALAFGQTMHSVLQQFHLMEVAGKEPGLAELLELYEKEFIDEGYESAEHKAERFEAGKQALTRYVDEYRDRLGKPWRLEQSFRLKLAGVTLIGKIDRIDVVEGDKYEIVDYKTGSLQKKSQVDKDEQLSVYALAAREALGVRAETQSLYFLEDGEKISTSRSDDQNKKKRKDLESVIEEMKDSDFTAKPGFHCQFCEFNRICPFAEK